MDEVLGNIISIRCDPCCSRWVILLQTGDSGPEMAGRDRDRMKKFWVRG